VIQRLPKWVEFGAFILALVAGYVNVIGLLGLDHQTISHLSGSATLLGASLAEGGYGSVLYLLGVLFSFLVGALLAGFLLHGTALTLDRHYQTALLVEATFLFGAYLLLSGGYVAGHFFASAACGLQNALATTFSGAIVRTTHVTGIFTDLGLMFGARLRGESLDKRKAKLFILIILGFISGGLIGALTFKRYAFDALLIPTLICLSLAIFYHRYQRRKVSKKA
jgi:uncharacterized membrane protein YoaK (UPF0700 family)